MAESNKILTVSYGTFSCTLEGFDDAFTTMKAIAEYFRDLAADDRFFGAEPPTPDAEMLAKLASRAAARRVEAHQDDNGIVLRQEAPALTAAAPAAEAAAPAPAEAAVDAPVAEQPVEAAVEEAVEDAIDDNAEAEAVAEIAEDSSDADDVVADVADAVADEAITDLPAVEDVVADIAAEADDEEADEMADAIAEFEAIAEMEAAADPAPQPQRPVLARNATAVVTRRPKAKPASAPNRPRVQVSTTRPSRTKVAAPSEAADAGDNTVADKLARIRGVVARNAAVAPNGFTEDQHAEGSDTKQAHEELAKAFEDAADASAEDLTPAVEDHAAEDHAEESDAIAATRAAIAAEFAEREAEQAVEDDDLDLSAAMAIANAPEEDDTPEADVVADGDLDDADTFDEEAFFADDEDEDDDFVADAPETLAAEEVEAPRPVARVLKVKRRDFEAAVEDGSLEEDEDEPEIPEAIARGESSLSPQDEAELQNELSALEAEIAGDAQDDEEDDAIFAVADEDDDEDDDDLDNALSWDMDDADEEDDDVAFGADEADALDDDEEVAAGPVKPRRNLLRGADDDMDRILAETDNQLGDSDGTRRRSAIQHLRAAVAATKAEKQAGAVAQDDEQEVADVYRDDLAQVVRPRRPVARGDAPSRRAEDRPAPLKLVAEQRVDLPGVDANAGPVRPRRVRMADLARNEQVPETDTDAEAHARAAAANAASFSEFAERVGAAGLPDLLEAAASYLSFVEGRDQFTRPQLMVKARQALEDEFSREDGLRHFGRLLREGKLRKVAAGHFTVSDRISFRPEERAAG